MEEEVEISRGEELRLIGRRWFVFIRLLVIVILLFMMYNYLNPNVKYEFRVSNKAEGNEDIGYAISEDGDGVLVTKEVIGEDFEVGDFIWVYFNKRSNEIVKMKRR